MKIYRMKLVYPVGLSDDKLIEFLRQLNLSWDSCCVHAECYCANGSVRSHGRFAYYRTAKYIQIPSFTNMYARDLTRTVTQTLYFDEVHGKWARFEIYRVGVTVNNLYYRYIGEA